MRRLANTTYTYRLDKDWMCDITRTTFQKTEVYDAWIYRNDMGVKELMFGVPVTQNTLNQVVKMVKAQWREYAVYYDERYN